MIRSLYPPFHDEIDSLKSRSHLKYTFLLDSSPISISSLASSFSSPFFTLGYIDEFEIVDDKRAGKIVINLNGRINKCGVISPRFDVSVDNIETWVKNLLPSRQFGHIVLTTSYGIMDHHEARAKHTGGKVLGFFY